MVARTPAKKAEEKKDVSAFVMPDISDDVLRNVRTAEDAMALAAELYGRVDSVADLEIGNGFKMLGDNKDRLVGVPLLVLATDTHQGNWNEFASALVITMDGTNTRCIMNDGGTGIYEQIISLRESTNRAGGWHFPKGLRKSEYPTCPECEKPCRKGLTTCPRCEKDIDQNHRKLGITYYFDDTE